MNNFSQVQNFYIDRSSSPLQHASAYQAAHVEVIKLDSDAIKFKIRPSFEALTFDEVKISADVNDDAYWRQFARELAIHLIDSLNLVRENHTLDDAQVAYNQVAPAGFMTTAESNGLDKLSYEEIPLPTVENQTDEDYTFDKKRKYAVPGDWLINPIDERIAEKMASAHGLDTHTYNTIIDGRQLDADSKEIIHRLIGSVLVRFKVTFWSLTRCNDIKMFVAYVCQR